MRETTNPLSEVFACRADVPEVVGHVNRLPFQGCLTLVDKPSDRAPSGARGHRVIVTRSAAKQALPSLIGMAIDYKADWDGHDKRQKCGVITYAEIDGTRILVGGYVYGRDFPEIELKALSDCYRLGMSYELADAHVADMRSSIWTLTRVTFTGAAILLKEKAAYKETSFAVCKPPLHRTMLAKLSELTGAAE
jgi:hypothetical protein